MGITHVDVVRWAKDFGMAGTMRPIAAPNAQPSLLIAARTVQSQKTLSASTATGAHSTAAVAATNQPLTLNPYTASVTFYQFCTNFSKG